MGETDATSNVEEMAKVVQQDQVSTAEVSTAVEVWIVCYSLYLILGMPISVSTLFFPSWNSEFY